CNPAPGAWTQLDGKQLKIFDVKPLPAKDPKGIGGKLGEIVAVEADGFTVVCADGRFKVSRVQPTEGKKIEASEWAKSVNLQPKARFTYPTTAMPGLMPAIHVLSRPKTWMGSPAMTKQTLPLTLSSRIHPNACLATPVAKNRY